MMFGPAHLSALSKTLPFFHFQWKTASICSILNMYFLSLLLQSQKDPAAVDRIMKDLDSNGDGEVNFEEFVSLVVAFPLPANRSTRMKQKQGAGGCQKAIKDDFSVIFNRDQKPHALILSFYYSYTARM